MKPCKYAEYGKDSPYEEVGLMCKHEETEHENTEEDSENDDRMIDEYVCCHCNTILETQKDLIEHDRNVHIDLFLHIIHANNTTPS